VTAELTASVTPSLRHSVTLAYLACLAGWPALSLTSIDNIRQRVAVSEADMQQPCLIFCSTTFQDMVCLDSCCEFFVAPEATSTETSPYFNFEVSANGTMLVYFCQPEIETQTPLPDYEWNAIKMAASLVETPGTPIFPEMTEPTTWQIEYHL
jgi:hypothetical protein